MNKLKTGFLVLAAVLLALPASSHAQSPLLTGIGSSGLFLELGEAAYASTTGTCAWSTSVSGNVVATDTSTGSALTDSGSSWVVWVPTSGNSCSSNAVPGSVWAYLQTDSVVGDRCLFNGGLSTPACTINYTIASGAAPSGLIEGGSEVNLPSAVAQVISGGSGFPGMAPNFSGTDIRAEDAEFAITRATTACGAVVGTGSYGAASTNQYLGLGYNNGDSIDSYYSGSTFHVIKFNLTSNFYTQPVGADPIVVAVNSTDAVGVGFNSPNITNLSRSTLALFLDGSIGQTKDALQPQDPETTSKPVTVNIREPLSGTYNTMEYNGPNTVMQQTSQDVGFHQASTQRNCDGTAVGTNPLHIENTHFSSFRNRAIGTGQELAETFATNDALGYSFWGVSNFAAAPTTSKYLTIDGVDPLFPSYASLGGAIPTSSAQLAKVTFTHMKDGTYPIWSLLRLVYLNSSLSTPILNLAEAAGTFSTSAHPDFLPFYAKSGLTYVINFKTERSHFTPPGIGYTTTVVNPACRTDAVSQTQEAGGDVGGVPIPCQVDVDYNTTTGAYFTNHRN